MSETKSRQRAETTVSEATTDFVAEGGRVVVGDGQATLDDRGRLMSAFGIRYDGRSYLYGTYRYDDLAEAVAYAQLAASRDEEAESPVTTSRPQVLAPTAEERLVMAALGISFEAGVYAFDGFHYDRLADAADYAAQLRAQGNVPADGAKTRSSER